MNQDALKQSVATAAMEYIKPKLTSQSIIGVGTGSTTNFFIDALATNKKMFQACVASSEATSMRLGQHGIKVLELNALETGLDVYVDGADECNPDLCLIKGGGAALTREKIVAACSQEFVCIIDQSKWVEQLGSFPLPVEVIPMARLHVIKVLKAMGVTPRHRQGVITDNGNDIIDVYDLTIQDPLTLEKEINQIVGVVCNGLFAHRRADKVLLAGNDGVRQLGPKVF